MNEEPTFLFEEPVFLVLVWPLLSIGLLALFTWLRRLFGHPGRAMSVLLVVWILIVVPFVPVRGLLVITMALAIGMTLAPFGLITPWGRRRFLLPRVRAKVRTWEEAGCALAEAKLPGDLRARARRLMEDRFELVEAGANPFGGKTIVLVRPDEGIVAGLDQVPRFRDPRVIATLTSLADSGSLAYETSNVGLRQPDPSGGPMLKEVFPYARPEVLLEHHLVGRRLLEERGIRFRAMDTAGARWFSEGVRRVECTKILEAMDGDLKSLRRTNRARNRLNKPRTLLELLADPALTERLDLPMAGR